MNPTCPKCRMEALQLMEYQLDVYCSWCVPLPHLGPPFNPDRWGSLSGVLEGRAAVVAEEARAAAVKRGEPSRPKPEQCKRGHTGEFTVRSKNDRPYWTCLACQRLGNKKSRERRDRA